MLPLQNHLLVNATNKISHKKKDSSSFYPISTREHKQYNLLSEGKLYTITKLWIINLEDHWLVTSSCVCGIFMIEQDIIARPYKEIV